mgnify:CR=1 FL=1
MGTDSQEVIKAFSNLAADYEAVVDAELHRFWGWSYEHFVEWLLDLVRLRQGSLWQRSLVLDIATGTALIPRKLVRGQEPVKRVVGVDITPGMLYMARHVAAPFNSRIALACGSGMALPLAGGAFDVAICALGTHHMEAEALVSEMRRVLAPGGVLAIADVAAHPAWKRPGIGTILRLAAFLYFLPSRNIARARAEAAAVARVHTVDEWHTLLGEFGFAEIQVTQPLGRCLWSPVPFAITAKRCQEE